MRKLVFILIAFIAVVTLIRAIEITKAEDFQKLSEYRVEININN
jgi:uncharacterized protein HemY